MMHTFQATDDCCDKALAEDLRAERIGDTVERWECPECGCEWRRLMVNGVAHWMPYEVVVIIGGKQRWLPNEASKRHTGWR